MNTKAKVTNNNMVFRDSILSPPEGQSLWETCPVLAMQTDALVAFEFKDDFVPFRTGAQDWSSVIVNSGTVGDGLLPGGTVALGCGGSGGDGIGLQHAAAPFAAAAGKLLWFEAILKLSSLGSRTFVGLTDDPSFWSGASIGATDWVGLYTNGSGVVNFGMAKGGVQATPVPVGAMAAGSYARLGFVYDGANSVTPWFQGTSGAVISTGAINLPTANLAVLLACYSNGTASPRMDVDVVRVVQLR